MLQGCENSALGAVWKAKVRERTGHPRAGIYTVQNYIKLDFLSPSRSSTQLQLVLRRALVLSVSPLRRLQSFQQLLTIIIKPILCRSVNSLGSMEIEAPTFSALNKPQRHAFILRDQLRFVDSQHLNEFLDGVSNDEPPTYTKVNGAIKPPLTLVTLKEEAKRFDLGNVYLPEENNNVHHVYLVVEDGHIQMRAEDPLPQDEDILDSCPIHGFIARGIVPLFKEKFQLIHARMNRINESRRAAYNMPNEAPALFHEGEVCLYPNRGGSFSIPGRYKHRVNISLTVFRPF